VGSAGATSASPLRLAVQPGDAPAVVIADPGRADPAWVAQTLPYYAAFAYGVGVTRFPTRHATSYDSMFELGWRFGQLDASLVGGGRIGVEADYTDGGMGGNYAWLGAGPRLGYTLRARMLVLRPTAAWLAGAAFHPRGIETWPHELDGELDIGVAERDRYPFAGPANRSTWSLYLRGCTTLGSFSQLPEPRAYTFGVGLVWRGRT
jgi:hypothetical protein